MRIDQIILIVGQIATWITVVIVFLTLREMEKQRRESYKPELVVPTIDLFGHGNKKGKLTIPIEWNKEILKDDSLPHDEQDKWFNPTISPCLTIYNLGLGAASNINIVWNYDIDSTIEVITDYCYKNSIPIIVKTDPWGLQINVDETFNLSTTSYPPFDTNFQIAFVPPISISPKGTDIHIPHVYKIIVSLLIYTLEPQDNGFFLMQTMIPPLKLTINYEDIGNRKYSKVFDVKLTINQLIHPFKPGDVAFLGKLESTNVK